MSKPIFEIRPTPSIPILQSEQVFPVRHIYCVGRNYTEHAKEMGYSGREAPFFFSKPADAIVVNPTNLSYPTGTSELHHEVELVVAIGKTGQLIEIDNAWDHVYGYALGIDLTKRDVQAEAKAKSRPWDMAKAFDQSAPISSIISKQAIEHVTEGEISLCINKTVKQQANINQMIWSIPEIIVELSQHITLQAGDLIFTGTPSGVGGIKKGQHVSASLFGKLHLEFVYS
ncbi:MAG: fumarylacetoacetate hydrolase family protein [Kangiellaceae bacterium]|nr:fumarylacetoacetate hydrolase family protein [Kangiellaceae bacterium]